MNKILITGGLGYIGSHTVIKVIENGYEPIIVDNLSNSQKSVHKKLEKIAGRSIVFYEGDLSNKKILDIMFSEHEIESVIHFAAFKAVGESMEKPLKYFSNNLTPMINLLEIMNKFECKNFIFSSSCTIYGQPETIPVGEDAEMQPAQSPYGETKQICEKILNYCSKANNLKVVCLRYFNPIGAHPSTEIGELPIGVPQNLVPFICQSAAGKRGNIKIWGNDYNTPDGTAIRDYIDINDLAEAHVCAVLRQDQFKKNFNVFNIGSGEGKSVLEIIKSFEEINNLKLNYEFSNRRPGDVEQIFCDPTNAEKLLKWTARTSIDESLKTAWKWQGKIK